MSELAHTQRPSIVNLGHLGRSLSDLARDGRLRAPIGRDSEIDSLVRALAAPGRDSVLLVGHSGTGKTALVAGVALALRKRNDRTGRRPLIEMMHSVLGSSTVLNREVMDSILASACTPDGPILVLDGMSSLFEVDTRSESCGSILWQAIQDKKVQCIGVTHPDEFERHFSKRPNLFKPFQVFRLEPLNDADTRKLLVTLKPELERRHGVEIAQHAVEAAVTLTKRYVPRMHFPGKAIEVLDRACGRYVLKRKAAASSEQWMDEQTLVHLGDEVGAHDVKRVVGEITAIDIDEREAEFWRQELAQRLARSIVGQTAAIQQLAAATARMRLRYKRRPRPSGMFFCAGARSVGKVFTFTTFTYHLLGSYDDLQVVNMRQFAEPKSFESLFGLAKDGTGDLDKGLLTVGIRNASLPVVVFNGVERAHPSFFEFLLPILDGGSVKDSKGNELPLRSALFVFTLNLDDPNEIAALDPDKLRSIVQKRFGEAAVTPMDAFISFRRLDRGAVRPIIRNAVRDFYTSVKPSGVVLRIHDDAYERLTELGFSSSEGRLNGLGRILREKVYQPMQNLFDSTVMNHGETVDIVVLKGDVAVRRGGSKLDERFSEHE